MPCLAPHGRYMLDRLERLALLQMPFHPVEVSRPSVPRPHMRQGGGNSLAAHLREYLSKERRTGEDGGLLALAEEKCFPQIFAHNIAAVIERGRVLREPGGHLGLPAWREQVFVLVFGHAGTYLGEGSSFEGVRVTIWRYVSHSRYRLPGLQSRFRRRQESLVFAPPERHTIGHDSC